MYVHLAMMPFSVMHFFLKTSTVVIRLRDFLIYLLAHFLPIVSFSFDPFNMFSQHNVTRHMWSFPTCCWFAFLCDFYNLYKLS